MDLPREADVVIVGGGIVGASCAAELAARGAKVVIIEKAFDAGTEGSGRAQGAIRLQGRHAAEAPLAARAREIWLEEAPTGQFELVLDGNIYFGSTPDERRQLEVLVAAAHDQGLMEVALLDSDETRAVIPAATGPFASAMYSPTDGHCQPIKATRHFMDKATSLGADAYYHTKALAISERDGNVTSVITNRGAINTPRVVSACGVWAPYLAATVGVDIPIMPVVLPMCETAPIASLFTQSLRSFRFSGRQRPDGRVVIGAGLGAKVSHGLSLYDLRHLSVWARRLRFFWKDVGLRVDVRMLLRQVAHWSNISTKIIEENPKEPRSDLKQMQRALVAASAVLPGLAEARIQKVWGGLIDMTPDGLPIVEADSGPDGLVIVTGLCGHGLALGPAFGEVAADLITGQSSQTDISGLRLDRFKAGRIEMPARLI